MPIFSTVSGVADSIYGKSQEPIKLMMQKELESFEENSAIPKIFKNVKTTNFAEKFTTMLAMDDFTPVGEGGAYPESEKGEGYSAIIEPDTWKNKFFLTQEMMEDKKSFEVSSKTLGFIQSYNRTKEKFGATLIENGANTSIKYKGKTYSTACADGKALFSAEHTMKGAKGTQSNKFADAFSKEALSAMETAMQNITDDKGNILNIAPDTIIIPNEGALKLDVFATIGADKDPNTSNNGFNYQFGRWNVIVWPYLQAIAGAANDATPWILMDSKFNETQGGAIWLDRLDLTVKSYIDNGNDNNVWTGRARFGAGFNNWRAFAIGGMSNASSLLG